MAAPPAAVPLHDHPPAGIATLFWSAINFAFYAGLMLYAYRRLARPVLRDRSMQVAASIGRAREELDAAQGELELRQAQLEQVGEEQEALKERLAREGENIARNLITTAERSAMQIKSDMRRRIQGEQAKAEAEIRAEVVRLAAERARAKLRGELGGDEDKRLRQEAVRSLVA
ncbi:MAG: ATP synthase F0 subunit B [Bdellovibrionales bacterium]|nr:ATP synthase F0 subunit B [Bdellovibrionales bacterium]